MVNAGEHTTHWCYGYYYVHHDFLNLSDPRPTNSVVGNCSYSWKVGRPFTAKTITWLAGTSAQNVKPSYELRTKLLVWGICLHQMWGVPYRLSGFWMFRASTSKQKHAIYSVGWSDLLHDRELQESKPRCASSFWQQMQIYITIKYSNAPSFILATHTIGTYENMKRRIALSLAHNKDSKPWTLSCVQSLFFPSLVCKNSFNMKEW